MIKSMWTKKEITPREYAKEVILEHLKALLVYEPTVGESPFALQVHLKGKTGLSKKDREVIFEAIQEVYMDIRLKLSDPVMFR